MKKLLSVAAAIDFYLHQRRQWGFELKQEGWILSTLGQYARQIHHRGPLTSTLQRSEQTIRLNTVFS